MRPKETGRDAANVRPEETRKLPPIQNVLASSTSDKITAAALHSAPALSNSLTVLAGRIRDEHQAVAAALNSAVIHAMAAGDLLIEAKEQVPHGHWRGWIADNCMLSERSVQLYMKLAKHREAIEKEQAKSAMGVADLTLNEAAALCVLAGRLEKILQFAKRAEGASPEQIVDLCVAEGFTVIKDDVYDPFFGRSEAEIREWILFGFFIGGGSSDAFAHAEWIIQRPFQYVDEWLGPEGSKFRQQYGWHDSKPRFHKGWARFKTEYADKTLATIVAEILTVLSDHQEAIPYLIGMVHAIAVPHEQTTGGQEALVAPIPAERRQRRSK